MAQLKEKDNETQNIYENLTLKMIGKNAYVIQGEIANKKDEDLSYLQDLYEQLWKRDDVSIFFTNIMNVMKKHNIEGLKGDIIDRVKGDKYFSEKRDEFLESLSAQSIIKQLDEYLEDSNEHTSVFYNIYFNFTKHDKQWVYSKLSAKDRNTLIYAVAESLYDSF